MFQGFSAASDTSHSTGGSGSSNVPKPPRPNILLITCDQYRSPRFSDGEWRLPRGPEDVLGFQDLAEDNSFAKYFPGLMKLRQNATVDDLAALLAQLEMRFLS